MKCPIRPIRPIIVGAALTLGVTFLAAHGEPPQASDYLVIENPHLKVAVDGKVGGRIMSFVDKATGWDYVGGGESADAGWGEYNFANFFPESEPIPSFKCLPYTAKLETGPGFKSITVSGSADGLKVTRTMTLADNSRQLDVFQRCEILDKPRRLLLRWQPWIRVDDETAMGTNTVVMIPGPSPCIRKINSSYGAGQTSYVLDNYMRPEIGCMIVANIRTGNGLWMTFQKENAPYVMTWNFGKGRGMAPELLGHPTLGKPGDILENRLTYSPFTPADASRDLPAGVITNAGELQTARGFAERVRPRLALIGPHEAWQRFKHISYGGYARPDMPAIYDWGIVECLFETTAAQDGYVRARFVAQAFPGKKIRLMGRVSLFDADGALVKQYESGAQPQGGGMLELDGDQPDMAKLDRTVDFPLAGVPDGEYRVQVEILGGDGKQSLYSESRLERFTGEKTAAMAKALEKEGDPPFRPFVLALSEKGGVLTNGVATVTIGVEEAGGVARSNWPVCAALALPQGAFQKGTPARLLDPAGKEVSAQVETAAQWPDGSLKWLHFFFGADVPSNGFAFYTAKVGEKPARPTEPDLADEDEAGITVHTGPLTLRIGKKGEQGIGRVTVDGREVLLPGADGDLWWEGGQGKRYHFIGDEASLLRNGPRTATVLLKGKYVDATGEEKCWGEIRLETSKGGARVRVLNTVVFVGDAFHDTLASFGMKLRTPAGLYNRTAALVDGAGKPVRGRVTLRQVNADRYISTRRKSETGRVDGAVLLTGRDTPALGLYVREFWRHYPEKMELDAARGEIVLSHWPAEAGRQDFLPPERLYTSVSSSPEGCARGMSKTHEVVLDWSGAESAKDVLAAHEEPVVALAAPQWNCATRAFAMLSAFDANVLPEVERQIHRVWQCLERHRELFGMYGEWANGNHRNAWWSRENSFRYSYHGRSVWLSNEDHHADSAWYLFARSGDRLFLRDAIGNSRAIRDVATTMYNPVYPDRVGGSARHHQTIWLGMGDAGHSALEGFIMDWILTGDTRSRQMAHLQAEYFRRIKTGSWRYISNPLSGLSRMYLETGDPVYKTKADWIATTFGKGFQLWDGTGDTYFTYGTEAIRWYAEIAPAARQLWIQGVQTNAPKDVPRFTSLGDIGSVWEITRDPQLAARAYQQGLGLLKNVDASADPRFRGIDQNGVDLCVHTFMRRALFLARAKEAMVAGAGDK